jgi:calcineurin-like phosphoesterase
MPHHLSVGRGKPVFNAMMVEVDEKSGKAISIERISRGLA